LKNYLAPTIILKKKQNNFTLTESALTVKHAPLRRCEVRDEPGYDTTRKELRENKLELGADKKLILLVVLQRS